ncbi:hypothetical protein BB780_08410 [Stenotrophomonas maltophilia]|nr:hypothetical protein BB780_08410 [Stenotrophomonas maltophilia]
MGGDAFNNYIVNPVARAAGMQEARPYREEASALADRLGLPKAQTAGDRVLGDVGEALTGTGLTLGIGGGINALANLGRSTAAPVTNQLASYLLSQPCRPCLLLLAQEPLLLRERRELLKAISCWPVWQAVWRRGQEVGLPVLRLQAEYAP